eukprot:scaffold13373_cov244-Amphora_coffeaeformis.AAC.1
MNQEQFKKLTLYQCACCALINDARAPLQVFQHFVLEQRRSPDGDEVDPYQWRLACNLKNPLPASEGYYRLYAIDKNGTGLSSRLMTIVLRATECDNLIQQFITRGVPYPEMEWVQQRHLDLKMLPRHWREFWDVQAWGRRPQRTVHDSDSDYDIHQDDEYQSGSV